MDIAIRLEVEDNGLSYVLTAQSLLCLLQLTSPALPVGAYSYSEGLEALVDAGAIANEQSLKHWLKQELHFGAIRLEAAVMVRVHRAVQLKDFKALGYWNAWLSAARETEELRFSSWQMGQSLLRLLLKIPQGTQSASLQTLVDAAGSPCNFAVAFGIATAHWQIDSPDSALLGYLHSWATNLIAAGVKLIPLGHTAGQQLLLELHPTLICATQGILVLADDDLNACGWGLALASMAHETQYTRLFRS